MMALDCLEKVCNLDPANCFENVVVVVACAAVEVLMMVFVFAAGN